MSGKNYYWRTISFAPEARRLELRMLGSDDDRPQTVPVVGWLTQEQVDDSGNRTGVAAIRVIAGILRPFSDDAAVEQEKDGWLAAEVIPADEDGWHVFCPDGRS
jgi:hypothetical protein